MRLLPAERRRLKAAYAVPFYLEVEAPHSSLTLAAFLLRFLYKATENFVLYDNNFNPRGLPFIKNIAYYIDRQRVYGVLFLDDGFAHWYNTLIEASASEQDHPYFAEWDAVAATFPRDLPHLRHTDVIDKCWAVTRYA